MNSETINKKLIRRQFAGFVSRNILGMMGMSCYYVIDTLFVSISQGADGVAALNLVSPPYYLIFAVGAMISNGSAIIYRIRNSQGQDDTRGYFTDALIFALIFSIPFLIIGIFFPDKIIELMGGDERIVTLGTTYMRIIMLFAPMLICNNIVTAFVRNDDKPGLAMRATLISSIFNIVGDYILMFPLNLGMTGAALASGFAPIVSISICSSHLRNPNGNVHLMKKLPDFRLLPKIISVGAAAFATKISTAIVILVYNFLILDLTGNTGLAAYGIISNIAIFVKLIFEGIADGSQPLLSEYYGKEKKAELSYLFGLGIKSAIISSIIIYLLLAAGAAPIATAFNSENSSALQTLTIIGIRLYFLAYVFGSFNTVCIGYFSATAKAGWAGWISFIRSCVALIVFAVLLAALFGMNGVWLSYAATELFVILLVVIGLNKSKKMDVH